MRKSTWSPAEILLLGTMYDPQLAKRLGRSRAGVVSKRIKLGISRFQPASQTAWTTEEARLLAMFDDLQVARMTGKSIREAAAKRTELAEK